MLRKVLTTTALATALLTSSISANDELKTEKISSPTAKVETVGAFDNIPSANLNSDELKEVAEGRGRIRLFWGLIDIQWDN